MKRARRVLAVLALVIPAAVRGQGATPPGPLVDVPIALVLNGEPRGDVFAKLAPDDGVLLRVDQVAALGVKVVGGRRYVIDGHEFVHVQTIPRARWEFDQKALSLALNLPAESFDLQRRLLNVRRAAHITTTADDSEFFNYRLGVSRDAGGGNATALAHELGARRGDWLGLTGGQAIGGDGQSGYVRFQTQLVRDERDSSRRWTFGDAFAQNGDLGSTLNLGGVTLARDFALTPYSVHSPTATVTGAMATPSDVEVYIGDYQVFRERLQPGAYELQDLSYYGGRRDVRVVVRDALGQERTVEFPYYYSSRLLSAGEDQYGYSAGLLRRNYGSPGDGYGPAALSAFHRYGVSDAVMVGGRGEYAEGRLNLGPEFALRSDRLGVWYGSLAFGRDGSGGGLGYAGGYQYLYGPVNFQLGARNLAPHYGLADPVQNASHILRELQASAGYATPALGAIGVQWLSRSAVGAPAHQLVQANYSRTLWRRLSLYLTATRDSSPPASTSVSVGVMGWFGDRQNASAFHYSRPDSRTDTLQVSNAPGEREGLRYRVAASNGATSGVGFSQISPFAQYDFPHAAVVVDADLRSQAQGGTGSDGTVAVQGSIYDVEGHWGFGRQVPDGFALVQLDPAVPNVRIYHSGQEIGRTDVRGETLLPGVASFLDSTIGIDDKDVPLGYTIASLEQTISPPFRGGSLVRFSLGVNRNIAGRLVRRRDRAPLEYDALVLQTPQGERRSQTGAKGAFYFDNLVAGDYAGEVDFGDGTCRFTLSVPEQAGPMLELAEPVSCE